MVKPKKLTVGVLKQFIENYPNDTEIIVTDGFRCNCYRGPIQIQEWITDEDEVVIDIGVGGCDEI